MDDKPVKVYLVCTGVGILSRGIETFARECFDGLHGLGGLQIELWKGAGPHGPDEHCLWNLPRTSRGAQALGKVLRRHPYVVEQLSSFLPLVQQIQRGRPDLIFYSEANLGFQLHRWRRWVGVPYRLLYSNGGPCEPPFPRTDFVQQVTPAYRDKAIAAGEDPAKHFLVPYGIRVPPGPPLLAQVERQTLRDQLGLPGDRPLILSVGWISTHLKRMDYLIREVAQLPEPRPHLMLLGHQDDTSPPIVQLARDCLGPGGFTVRSVSYGEVVRYYQTADVFALASLQEGFGRVFLEALIHGLPCLVHGHATMRYVLGNWGCFVEMDRPGALAQALTSFLPPALIPGERIQRRDYVRSTFSWEALAPHYLEMFRACLTRPQV